MKRSFGMKNFAFTLVEVLITLTIIGVVAALTLPNIMKNIERKDLETAFKKSYSVISQAIAQMKAQEGAVWAYYNKVDNSSSNSTVLKNAMMPYFNVINKCTPSNLCPPSNSLDYKNFSNNSDFGDTSLFTEKFYTADGMLISPTVYGSPNDNVAIWVDTNGWGKKPNRAGYDLFLFEIMQNDSVLPMGTSGTLYSSATQCSTSSIYVTNGYTCAYRAVKEKDYFKNLP